MFSLQRSVITLSSLILIVCVSQTVAAENDKQLIQQQLNQQVLAQSLNDVDDATLSKELKEATERGTPSKSKTQTQYYQYWHNGYYYPYAAYRLGYWY